MKLVLAIVLATAACGGGDDTSAMAADARVPGDSNETVDAARDAAPDAPPVEVCTAAGWCQDAMAPDYTWGLSVLSDGQPWTVAYGVRVKRPSGWQYFDLHWDDLVDPFTFHTELYSVYALSATNVWVGGTQGYVGHFDGATWREYRPSAPDVIGIWGATANDVWMLHDTGARSHWDGDDVVAQPASTTMDYLGVWGRAADDIWGWGESEETANHWFPAFEHYDGSSWSVTVLPGYGKVISLWAASATDVFVVISYNGQTRVLRGAGSVWTEVTDVDVTKINAIWGRAADDVWAVGNQGKIVHFDGQDWTASASGTTASLTEISGTGSVLWVAGNGVALHHP